MLSVTNFVHRTSTFFCKYAKCFSPVVKTPMLKYCKIGILFYHKQSSSALCSLKYLNPRCLFISRGVQSRCNHTEHDGLRYLDVKYSIRILNEERYNVTPDNIWKCFHTVVIEEYANLSHMPWLCRYNYATMHRQLNLNHMLPTLFRHIEEDDYFKFLIEELNSNVNQVPDQHVPSILSDMLHLEIKACDVFYKLYERIHEIIPTSSLNSLAHFAYLWQYFKSDYVMLDKAMFKLKELVIENDELDICDLFSVVRSLRRYMSSDFLESIAGKILRMDINTHLTCDLRSNISSLRLLNILRKFQLASTPEIVNLADKLSELAMTQIQNLDGFQISVLQHHAMLLGSSNGPRISRVLQKRSLELLSDDDVTTYDMTRMLAPFNAATPLSMKPELEVYIMQKIKHGDVDVLSASRIGRALVQFQSQNLDLITVLQKHLVDNFEQHVATGDRLHKLSSLRLWNTSNRYLKHDLFDKVVKLFDSRSGITVWDVSMLSNYILTTATDVIPNSILMKILAIVPQCNAKKVHFIILGLKRMPKLNANSLLYAQFFQIFKAVDRNVHQHQLSIENIRNHLEITLLAKKMDVSLLELSLPDDDIESIKFSHPQFMQLNIVLSKMNYCQPHLMEKMCKFVLDKSDVIAVVALSKFINTIAKNGYSPKHLDRLNEIYSDLSYKFINNLDKVNLVQLANDLAVLQVFPDILLHHIFSFEFIEQIDGLSAGRQDTLASKLMLLTRSVILECPHLDIPWFHEDEDPWNLVGRITQHDQAAKGDPSMLHLAVEDALDEVVGGPSFYRTKVLAPYNYMLQFECTLDADQQPVKYNVDNEDFDYNKLQKQNHQRVAINYLPKGSFCDNVRQKTGYTQQAKRHLEIMNYKVVEIPYYEWTETPMAEQVEYLRNKILEI